jgi:hypothetical protein
MAFASYAKLCHGSLSELLDELRSRSLQLGDAGQEQAAAIIERQHAEAEGRPSPRACPHEPGQSLSLG